MLRPMAATNLIVTVLPWPSMSPPAVSGSPSRSVRGWTWPPTRPEQKPANAPRQLATQPLSRPCWPASWVSTPTRGPGASARTGRRRSPPKLAKVAKKDPRWRFLHAIPVGNRGSDIDHIIIGPGGVFTANAKNHPGAKIWVGGNTFMVNGVKQPYVRNARHEAQRAATILTDACGFPVLVEGLIVTVNASDIVVKTQPESVSVTPRMQVARWLLRHGDILTPETIDAIYDVARRSTTWR